MRKLKKLFRKPSSSISSFKGFSDAAHQGRGSRGQGPEDASLNTQIRMDTTLWPVYEMKENTTTEDFIEMAGDLLIDITDHPGVQWARGGDFGPGLGKPVFARAQGASTSHSNIVPGRLFDLTTNQVISTEGMEDAPDWAVISHVWGETTEIDGRQYGVDWKIPIRSEEKLAQILEAARVVVGERYIWMDVLCLDQRSAEEVKASGDNSDEDEDDYFAFMMQTPAEMEITYMREYFQRAVGCFVWLDNSADDPAWPEVLDSIQELNGFFRMDRHGTPLPEAVDRLMRRERVYDSFIPYHDVAKWMSCLTKLEKAAWFKRVWTLQEAVVPDKVWLCTPERYMTGGAQMWIVSALLEAASRKLVATGSMKGAFLAHRLQRSEIYKTAKLRWLDRRGFTSFWHMVQAAASRQCRLEHDRVFGVIGLIQSVVRRPSPNYRRDHREFKTRFYSDHTFTGDFYATLFIGGPSSIKPKMGESMPYLPPRTLQRQENVCVNVLRDTDSLKMCGDFTWDKFGWDRITTLIPIQGWGALEAWGGKSTQITAMSPETQREIARAFELDDTAFFPKKGNGWPVCPGAIAAAIAPTFDSPDQKKLLAKLDPDVRARVEQHLPAALMQWLKILYVAQGGGGTCALVAARTESSGTKLALMSEQPAGSYVAVMPGSYGVRAGPGFVLCRIRDPAAVFKVGVGLGRNMKPADLKGDFMMLPA